MSSSSDPRASLPEFLVPFASMHDAMRRDADRLVETVARLDARATVGEWGALTRWWWRFSATILGHHVAEDDIVWPAMVEHIPDFAESRDRLVDQHHALDRAMDAVGEALEGATAGAGASRAVTHAVEELRRVLVAHLADEEETVFPRLELDLPRDAYERAEREIQRRGSLRDAAFELPWVLDGASPRVRAVIGTLVPAPMRLLDRLVWERRYRRLASPLRTGA